LYGEQKEDKILLYWNTYSSYINGTAYYRVFYKRRNSYIEVLRTQDSSALLSIKDLSPDPNAKYLYFFITAVEKGTNIYSLHGESTSKILKLPLKPIISIPNAIRPSSHIRENRYFIPKVAFAANVEVLIFNKNGETIFYAPHNNNYWDGTYKGKILSPGYYNYVIKIIDYQGNIIQKKGYIYLLP